MNIMKIITLTLNPAFDIHCSIDNLQLYKENYASHVTKNAGGKGVNISRALAGFGIPNTSYCVLGRENGEEFYSALKNDGVFCLPLMTDGRIRENLTVHSRNGETRISFEGFAIDTGVPDKLYDMIRNEITQDTFVTFTGRLPAGITANDATSFLSGIKKLGAKLVVDCNSFSADELFKIKPYLIKPNEQEISALIGKDISTEADALSSAKEFLKGGIQNVIVSLGAKGFAYATSDCAYIVHVPEIKPISTIGAGDSLIAGYLAGVFKQLDTEEVLKLAASFGTAACLTEGTEPPEKANINKLFEKIKCERK